MPNPHSEDAAYWEAASECYHNDRIDEALRYVALRGIGEAASEIRLLRLIEAEALVREFGEKTAVTEWLTLETIPGETLHTEKRISKTILKACSAIEQELQWNEWPKTLLCILSKESETPWATNPNGYWLPKENFDKICLPFYLLDDPEELLKASAHELAHVATASITNGRAPTWLHEAVSMWMEQFVAKDSLEPQYPEIWLDPSQLERLIEQQNPESPEEVFSGYLECQWIGRFIVEYRGPASIAMLLHAHGDESWSKNIRAMMKGMERVDQAVREVLGVSVDDLFQMSKQWMLETKSGLKSIRR